MVPRRYRIEGTELFYDEVGHGSPLPHLIKGADASSIVIFNFTWAKDANHVWCNGRLIKKAFAPAFVALNECFGRDNECVFESLGTIVKNVNVATFTALDDGVVVNDRGYRRQTGYARCDGKIYHFDWGGHRTMWMRGADAETFEALKWGYGRDQRRAFCGSSPIKGAIPKNFRQMSRVFSTDERRVFYLNREVPNADPNTFEIIGDEFWARDSHRVFYQDKAAEGAHPESARLVGGFLVDTENVFAHSGRKVDGLDPSTFEQVGDARMYYRDRRGVYHSYSAGLIEGADPLTFEYLGKGADRYGEAQDAHSRYRDGQRLGPREER